MVKKHESYHALPRFKKTNDYVDTFMFKNDHSTNLLLQRRKININARFTKNFSATKRTTGNFFDFFLKSETTEESRPDIEITQWETHFEYVLNHSSGMTDQIDDHDRAWAQANWASSSE